METLRRALRVLLGLLLIMIIMFVLKRSRITENTDAPVLSVLSQRADCNITYVNDHNFNKASEENSKSSAQLTSINGRMSFTAACLDGITTDGPYCRIALGCELSSLSSGGKAFAAAADYYGDESVDAHGITIYNCVCGIYSSDFTKVTAKKSTDEGKIADETGKQSGTKFEETPCSLGPIKDEPSNTTIKDYLIHLKVKATCSTRERSAL